MIEFKEPPIEAPVIPNGLCQCGCGKTTKVATQTRANRGWVKGQPKRFLPSHGTLCPVPYLLDPETNCWVWQRAKTGEGYGSFRVNGVLLLAHRVSYEQSYGVHPGKLDVLHKCDNPSCVNPAHLTLGTARENAVDMVIKGRWSGGIRPSGSNNGNSKLVDKQVLQIRKLGASGMQQRTIARKFGLAQSTVGRILRRKMWKHL